LFGENNPDFRRALERLPRYIATPETAKHRLFVFLDESVLPDNMLINIASADAWIIAALSSRTHLVWATERGATLEDRPRFTKTIVFDPFPFPDPDEALREKLRAAGEELDAFRKARQAEHPGLTLTGMYNVREKLRAMARVETRSSASKSVVMPWLDHGIHSVTVEAGASVTEWIAGSSPLLSG